jgi:hypothetical protein
MTRPKISSISADLAMAVLGGFVHAKGRKIKMNVPAPKRAPNNFAVPVTAPHLERIVVAEGNDF